MNSNPHQSNNADPDEHLSIQQIQTRYDIGPETLIDWFLGSDMPASHRYGRGRIGWKISELEEWEHKHQLWEKIGKKKKTKTAGGQL